MSATRPRFHELDLLRGVACAMVIGFHFLYRGQQADWLTDAAPDWLAAAAQFGGLGVHLFFIISGFVIFMSAEGVTVRQFAASRVARLYPAMWVAAPLTAFTAWALVSGTFGVTPAVLAANLTMVPQWFKIDYVDGSYWSLAVELQFYILIGLMLALRLSAHIEKLMLGWLALCLVDLIRPIYPLEFWLSVNWAQYFCAGITCYLVRLKGLTPMRGFLLLTCYGLMLAGWLRHAPGADNPWISALMPALIVTIFFVIFLGIAFHRWDAKPTRIGALAGALTYPVYLVHQNFGYLLIEWLKPIGLPFLLRVGLVVVMVLVIAWVIHHRVEKPLGKQLRQWIAGNSPASGKVSAAASR